MGAAISGSLPDRDSSGAPTASAGHGRRAVAGAPARLPVDLAAAGGFSTADLAGGMAGTQAGGPGSNWRGSCGGSHGAQGDRPARGGPLVFGTALVASNRKRARSHLYREHASQLALRVELLFRHAAAGLYAGAPPDRRTAGAGASPGIGRTIAAQRSITFAWPAEFLRRAVPFPVPGIPF